MKAVGYARYSQTSDTGIEKQIEYIRNYASKRGYDLRLINDGERSSGFDDEREGFQELQEMIPEIDVVIVTNARRLARDFDTTMRLILDLRKHDVEVHTRDAGQLDLADPVSVAVEVMKAGVDHERKTGQIERAKEAIEERIDDGCWQGRPPVGLQFADDKCHLVKDPDVWPVCEEIWRSETIPDVSHMSKRTAYRIKNKGREEYERILQEYGKTESE